MRTAHAVTEDVQPQTSDNESVMMQKDRESPVIPFTGSETLDQVLKMPFL